MSSAFSLCVRTLCALVIIAAAAAPVRADMAMNGQECTGSTSVEFILDTSASTDSVGLAVQNIVRKLGDTSNGPVLSFSKYFVSTWANNAEDYLTKSSITEVKDYLLGKIGKKLVLDVNLRVTNTSLVKNDDFQYMMMSLAVAVDHALDYGVIMVLGDLDELCDARSTAMGNALNCVPGSWETTNAKFRNYQPIIDKAKKKHLTISFFYLFPGTTDPFANSGDPCPYSSYIGCGWNYVYPKIVDMATQTGGMAEFKNASSGQIDLDYMSYVKTMGSRPAVCNDVNKCTADAGLGLVLDTSGWTDELHAQLVQFYDSMFDQFDEVLGSGEYSPFQGYYLSTFANPANASLSFQTLIEMHSYLGQPAAMANNRPSFDTSLDKHNDWKYVLESLQYMVPKVGASSFIIVLTDQESVCDVVRFNNVYSVEWQGVVSAAVARQITISFYIVENGNEGAHPGTNPPDCVPDQRATGEHKLVALASILGGTANLGIDITTADAVQSASETISFDLMAQATRPPCSNCTENATLAFVVDSSTSAGAIKFDLRAEFAKMGSASKATFKGFVGGFMLNTWAMPASEFKSFATMSALNAFLHPTNPADEDPLDSKRYFVDSLEAHDDWAEMVSSLTEAVVLAQQDGVVVVLADDNQLCDASTYSHTDSESDVTYLLQLAQTKDVHIYYFAFATANPSCGATEQTTGAAIAAKLATVSGGSFTQALSASALRAANVTNDKVLKAVAADASRPVCKKECPPNSVFAGTSCITENPCLPNPCFNGGTCVGEFYTQNYHCTCDPKFSGDHCQFGCTPLSTPNITSHAFGLVVDTSDSSQAVISSMGNVIAALGPLNGKFDAYLLSTWAYTHKQGAIVHPFASMTALAGELATADVKKSKRYKEDGDDHNDWLYMLDSLNTMIPLMGENGVIFVLADEEQVCDADGRWNAGRTVARYPLNPQSTFIDTVNQKALLNNIKIYYFTYPSYSSGQCHAFERATGYDGAHQLVHSTGGLVSDQPHALGPDALALKTADVLAALVAENNPERCECPAGSTKHADNMCYPNSS